MNLLELRAALTALLSDELGVFNNGTPAIWVEPPLIPPDLFTDGLQCRIRAVPIGETIAMSAGQRLAKQSYIIDLVNYDSSTSLLAAKVAIEQAFILKRDPIYNPPTAMTLEQCQFWIFAPIVRNPRA